MYGNSILHAGVDSSNYCTAYQNKQNPFKSETQANHAAVKFQPCFYEYHYKTSSVMYGYIFQIPSGWCQTQLGYSKAAHANHDLLGICIHPGAFSAINHNSLISLTMHC